MPTANRSPLTLDQKCRMENIEHDIAILITEIHVDRGSADERRDRKYISVRLHRSLDNLNDARRRANGR